MTISPTLGISNQYNPAPMEQYAAIASQGLQQLGAQVQQDITTIQTNQQLRGLQSDLQGINPTDTKSPAFGAQMTRAVLNNPLAAHSPVGMEAINQLGQAHQAALQSDTRLGVAGLGAGAREYSADVGAGARTDVAGINADSRENIANINAQSRADANGNKSHVTRPGDKVIDGKGNILFENPPESKTVKPTIVPLNAMVLDADNNVIATNKPDSTKAPTEFVKDNDKAEADYGKAVAVNTKAQVLFGQTPDDPIAKANAAAAESARKSAEINVVRTRDRLRPYQQSSGTPVDGLGSGAAPSPSPVTPSAGTLPSTGPQNALERTQSLDNAAAQIKKAPSQRAAIILKLKKNGFTDDEIGGI